jgi:lycopene beta-cyclase
VIKNNQLAHQYSCKETPYLMLPSNVFYEAATRAIKSNTNIKMLTGEKLQDNLIKSDSWQISTSKFTATATNVIDTRPSKKIIKNDSLMWQSFVGYEVELETPLFDQDELVLMDFDSNFKEGLGFIYFLPISSSKALIEYTVFSKDLFIAEQLKSHLIEKISEYTNNTTYKIIRQEAGILPMGNRLIQQKEEPSYLFAGLFAGAARPSSGYAFQRIQAWAKECAKELIIHQKIKRFKKDSWIQMWMDLLFITVIKKNPSLGAKVFEKLFKNCEIKTIANFMSDHSTFVEKLRIVAALPKLTFLLAIPELIRSKRRLDKSD